MARCRAGAPAAQLPSWDGQWDERGRSMARTHVILDDRVLAAIDEVAGERGRSAFLEGAAREKLQRLQLLHALDETAGLLDIGNHPEWRDREATAHWVREQRRGR